MKCLLNILNFFIYLCVITPFITSNFNASDKSFDEIFNDALNIENYLIQTRRIFHQHPETQFEEYETSELIKQFLMENNINYTEGWGIDSFNPHRGGTGILADIGNGQQPCVIIRADIDALPVFEKTEFPFKSTHPGKMHACGHDGHITMALGAAYLIKKYENEIEGTVRFMFTPAEEGGGGVKMMIDEGALEVEPKPQRAFGFHIDPRHPTGTIYTKPGVWTCASDFMTIKVKGKGGHGAMPHLTIDPIPASLAIARGLYDIYARETYFQQQHTGLLGIAHFEAGTGAPNIIPPEVVIGGGVQALETQKLHSLKKRIKQMAESIAEGYQCSVTISHRNTPYNAVVNDAEIFPLYEKIVKEGTIDHQLHLTDAIYAGEDFCFLGDHIPSIYSWFGIGSGTSTNGDPVTSTSLHNAYFTLDESIIARGAALHAYIAIQNIVDLKTMS